MSVDSGDTLCSRFDRVKLALTCVQAAAAEAEAEWESRRSCCLASWTCPLITVITQCAAMWHQEPRKSARFAISLGQWRRQARQKKGAQAGRQGRRQGAGSSIIIIICVVSSCWHNDKRTFIKFLISDFIVD